VLEQVFEVEYLVQGGQCPDCAKLAAKNTWKAAVQVRQKVPHKRTFLFLEQLLLKNGIQKDTISVKEVKDGLDFFYASRSHAIKTVEFLASVVPVRSKASEQLLSSDTHSNTANYKFTYSVEIAPICKDDLVCLPAKVARAMGNIAQLVVCTRVGNSIHFTDPATLQTAELSAQSYWRAPFAPLGATPDLTEFTVLDCEPSGATRGRFTAADAQVALSNAFQASSAGEAAMDYDDNAGANDGIYHTRTHLGSLLQAGDTALGYHLTRRNFNSDDYAALPAGRIPDVVLVKKTYPNRRKKNKTRGWRLRSMAKEAAEDDTTAPSRGVVGRMGGRDQKKVDNDYEIFLRDLEEDPEMRSAVNLYKAPTDVNMTAGSGLAGGKTRRKAPAAVQEEDTDMDDARTEGGEEHDEADFPDVKLDELLEDFDEMTLENHDE
jgi:nonsense-mediated mRNA decay protein 3